MIAHLGAGLATQPTRGGPATWDWSFAWEILPELLRGLWVTVKVTVLANVLALSFGLILAILRRSRIKVISWPVAWIVEFIRGTPLIIQLFFLFYVLPRYGPTLSAFTCAVVGLGLHYACYTSEAYRAGIESVPRGQWEATTAINLPRWRAWTSVVLPQAIPTSLPALGNYVVASLKDAPIAASITVIDVLGTALRIQSREFRDFEAFTIAGVLFLAVSVPAALLVRRMEKHYGFERV